MISWIYFGKYSKVLLLILFKLEIKVIGWFFLPLYQQQKNYCIKIIKMSENSICQFISFDHFQSWNATKQNNFQAEIYIVKSSKRWNNVISITNHSLSSSKHFISWCSYNKLQFIFCLKRNHFCNIKCYALNLCRTKQRRLSYMFTQYYFCFIFKC